jgi:hypothetical protein
VLGGISGDNRTVKNINIHIDNLGAIDSVHIRGPEDEEDLESFRDNLTETLMTILNDTNTNIN